MNEKRQKERKKMESTEREKEGEEREKSEEEGVGGNDDVLPGVLITNGCNEKFKTTNPLACRESRPKHRLI